MNLSNVGHLKESRVGHFILSLAVAATVLFGIGHMTLPAHAADDAVNTDPITANDILPSTFGDATGLGQADLNDTIGAIIRAALGFLGVIAVVIILFGGFKWMTAGGNEEKVGEAKKLIIAGIIGLAIILSAYAIASFVIGQLVGATT